MRNWIERIAAGVALVVLSPLLLAAAILIVADSGWPFLFRQTRIGQGGRPFSLLKLRSMRSGVPGTPITAGGDQRVTAVGAVLRKYKLDELPQFWHVFRGEMQWIGPRPEVPQFVKPEDPMWREILLEKPGLTDLASLVYRNEEEILSRTPDPVQTYAQDLLPRKAGISNFYRRNRTWGSDCRLLWMTVKYSLFPARFDARRILGSFRELG